METFSGLLAFCVGNSPVTGEFPAQRPVTRSFDIFLDLRLNKRMNKQWWGWWFEAQSCPLWRHPNAQCWYMLVKVSVDQYGVLAAHITTMKLCKGNAQVHSFVLRNIAEAQI